MDRGSKFSQYVELSIILFLHLMNHILMFSLPVLILFIREEFFLTYTQTGVLWTTLIVVMTFLSIGVGLLSDKYRRSRYILVFVGLIFMSLGWLFVTRVTTFKELQLVFAFIGMGASGFHPPMMAKITELFENDKGKALSIFQTVGMGGTAVSPLIFVGIGIIAGPWEFVAKIYFAFSLGLILIMSIISINTGMFSEKTAEIQAKVDGLFLIDADTPSFDLSFLLTPLVIVPLLFFSIRISFLRISVVFTSLIYEDYLSLTKNEASVATSLVLGIATLFILVGGALSDKTNPTIAIIVSGIGTFLAVTAIVLITDYSNLVSFSISYFLLNAFYYVGSPATSALLSDRVAPELRGKMFGAIFSLGQVLSLATPLIFGWIKDNQGLRSAFMFLLVLAGIALIIGLYIYFEEKSRDRIDKPDINS